ncbi:hypothetical protein BHM03_00016824, partial [Ensete ventricosum]
MTCCRCLPPLLDCWRYPLRSQPSVRVSSTTGITWRVRRRKAARKLGGGADAVEARVKKKNGKKTGRRERTKDTQRRRGVPADGGAGERRRGGPEAVVRD